METLRLYYENPKMTAFTATVTACKECETGFLIALDATAFYPEGGGQPCDVGTLDEAEISDVQETEGVVWHLADSALAVGSRVQGRIDSARRFDLTIQHTADHIISGIIHKRYGFDNVGFHMGADVTTIDLNGTLELDELLQMEYIANSVIWQNLPIETLYPTAAELARTTYRSKKEIEGQVRLIKIPGIDLCACCGTHAQSTGEVGLLKILSCVRFKGGTRFEYAAGERAYRYVDEILYQNRRISKLLSAKPTETGKAVRGLYDRCEELKATVAANEEREMDAMSGRCRNLGNNIIFTDRLSADSLRRLAIAVTDTCCGCCAVFSAAEEGGYRYAIGDRNGNLKEFTAAMNEALSGRGGGKPDFVQGSVGADRSEIEQYFKSLEKDFYAQEY